MAASEGQFFSEPYEVVFSDSLKAQYPEMTETDIIVCIEVYLCWHDESPRIYDEISARLEHAFDEKDWETIRQGAVGKTYAELNDEVLAALYLARKRGYISYRVEEWGNVKKFGFCKPYVGIVLRQDIFDALEGTRYSDFTRHPSFDFDIETASFVRHSESDDDDRRISK